MIIDLAGQKIKVVIKGFEACGELGRFMAEPELTIQIKPGMKPRQFQRVLLHEMFHALLCITGSGFSVDPDREESIVLSLEYYAEQVVVESKRASKLINKSCSRVL